MNKQELTVKDLEFLIYHHPHKEVRHRAFNLAIEKYSKNEKYIQLINIAEDGKIPKKIRKKAINILEKNLNKLDLGDLYHHVIKNENLPHNLRKKASEVYVDYYYHQKNLMWLYDIRGDEDLPEYTRKYANEKVEELVKEGIEEYKEKHEKEEIYIHDVPPFKGIPIRKIIKDENLRENLREELGKIEVEELARFGLYDRLDELKNEIDFPRVKKKIDEEIPNAIKKHLEKIKRSIHPMHHSWIFKDIENLEEITKRHDIPKDLKKKAKNTISKILEKYIKVCRQEREYNFLADMIKDPKSEKYLSKEQRRELEEEINQRLNELAEILVSS